MNRYDSNRNYIDDFIEQWNQRARSAKIGMIALGALLVIAGIASALAPLSLYGTIQAVIAVLLVAHGIIQIVGYVQTPEFFRNAGMLVNGILNALLGVLLFALPAYLTATTIVFLLAFLFISTGIERVSFARSMRFYETGGSTAGTVTGVLNIVLGVLFLIMPIFSSVVIGYLMAAYLVIGGVTLIAEGITIKKIER